MTAQAQTLFICDRCTKQTYIETSTSSAKLQVPNSWRSLYFDYDGNTGVLNHLCPTCAQQFEKFMTGFDLEAEFEKLKTLHSDAMAAIRRLKYQRDEAYKKARQEIPALSPVEERAVLTDPEPQPSDLISILEKKEK